LILPFPPEALFFFPPFVLGAVAACGRLFATAFYLRPFSFFPWSFSLAAFLPLNCLPPPSSRSGLFFPCCRRAEIPVSGVFSFSSLVLPLLFLSFFSMLVSARSRGVVAYALFSLIGGKTDEIIVSFPPPHESFLSFARTAPPLYSGA